MNTITEDIELAKEWAKNCTFKPGEGEGWRHVCFRLANEVERLRAENQELREGLSKVTKHIGNGSFASADCTLDFLAVHVPEEVRLYCERLRRESDEKSRELERHKSLVTSLQDRVSKLETTLEYLRR